MYKPVYLQYNGVVRVDLLKINVLIPGNIFIVIITVEPVSFAQKCGYSCHYIMSTIYFEKIGEIM